MNISISDDIEKIDMNNDNILDYLELMDDFLKEKYKKWDFYYTQCMNAFNLYFERGNIEKAEFWLKWANTFSNHKLWTSFVLLVSYEIQLLLS